MAKAPKKTTRAPLPEPASRHDELRVMLEQRRQAMIDELHGRLRGVRAESAQRTPEPPDPGETADVDIQGDIEFALIQMKAETLDKVNEALARLDEGRYGHCFDCGHEIPAARLRAMLFAVRCTECEQTREDRGRSHGPKRDPAGVLALQR